MPSLQEQILSGASADALERHLSALTPDERRDECVALAPRAQRLLWLRCEGRAVRLDDIVPPSTPVGAAVRHIGRNTLPAFKRFEKRFCRPAEGAEELWGYNEGPTRPLVGPGYFICRATPSDPRGAVVIDYERVPPASPEGWPDVAPNERGVSRFVYAHMHDFLRRVSEHVTIGRAYRHGKDSPNYFVLCRWDERRP